MTVEYIKNNLMKPLGKVYPRPNLMH